MSPSQSCEEAKVRKYMWELRLHARHSINVDYVKRHLISQAMGPWVKDQDGWDQYWPLKQWKEGLSPPALGLSNQSGWPAMPALRSDHCTCVGCRDSGQVLCCKRKWQKTTHILQILWWPREPAPRSWDSGLCFTFIPRSLLSAAGLSMELFLLPSGFYLLDPLTRERVKEVKEIQIRQFANASNSEQR